MDRMGFAQKETKGTKKKDFVFLLRRGSGGGAKGAEDWVGGLALCSPCKAL